jgi:proteasome component ECM29
VSLGRIDVLYALLMLSISHPAWFMGGNRYNYSAASLLGEDSIAGSRTNSTELRAALRPHLGRLLPRILRATQDPNKQSREQMSSLWNGLTGGGSESRAVVTEHLLPIVDSLIDDCTSKLWRARSGACSALAEVLVGRSWEDLGGGPAHLDDDDVHINASTVKLTAGVRVLRLFRYVIAPWTRRAKVTMPNPSHSFSCTKRVAMRALDDVRGAVRDSGEQLARTLRALSIRLCTRSLKESPNGTKLPWQENQSHEKNASAASATVLRWLIKHGLNQKCAEATGICLSTLVEIIDVVQPKILQPLIPELLLSLLKSMSSLEPSALNYLQARSGGQQPDSALSYESLERIRLRLAQSGPLASAVTKLLDALPSVSIQTQREVVPQLDVALRQSVGFASRAATADAVSVLCNSCPNAFKFQGSGNTNPSVRLLRALYFASERERGQHARDKMVHSLGNLAALCPGSSVRVLARKACEKYTASTGNNEDPASRRASAAALRSIAVRASNQLSDGGPSDVWSKKVLPVAFLGKKDEDAKIASLFNEVWDEGAIAIDASHASQTDGFGRMEEQLLPYLVEECCSALMDNSWTRRVAGAHALVDLCNAGVLSPNPRSLFTTKSADSSAMKRAQRRAQASNLALKTCTWLLSRSRLWTGKASVTNSVVSIASKWASAVIDSDSNGETLFGWTGDDPCPWQPIVVTASGFDDLFLGDGWFRQKQVDEEVVRNLEARAPQTIETDEDEEQIGGALNFEECDRLPESEEEKQNGKQEASFKETTMPTFVGLALFLLDQAMPAEPSRVQIESEEYLPYRVAAFTGLRDLMASISESSSAGTQLKRQLFYRATPRLISMCQIDQSKKSEVPPVLVARAMDCLAAFFWEAMGKIPETQCDTSVLGLTTLLVAAGGKMQPTWTVREASRLCMASLASKCHADALRDHKVVSMMVDSTDQSQRDLKFWKVRLSGLKLLQALVGRAGSRAIGVPQSEKDKEMQILLEAILPHKEAIMAMVRKSLTDPEAKVTALGSDILGLMSWWP